MDEQQAEQQAEPRAMKVSEIERALVDLEARVTLLEQAMYVSVVPPDPRSVTVRATPL